MVAVRVVTVKMTLVGGFSSAITADLFQASLVVV